MPTATAGGISWKKRGNGAKLLLRAYYSQASGRSVTQDDAAFLTGRRPANSACKAGASH
ncbi:hypothetical protein [Dyadobacter jiangsuensis]|uniref:Uncharacterized protein n=1 Tax=Dyadobacter jiangsuensis TaxID=1591085 RepID=A0A2P8FPE0_9BACT|nr:hypothetical protein [Dyadobacter jiangsuensis]PSL23598.1 hypothetical protein CLV60_116154 [Dyadobacter jiangsuensis]